MSRSWLLHSLLFHTAALSYWIIRQNSLTLPNYFFCFNIQSKYLRESHEPQLGIKAFAKANTRCFKYQAPGSSPTINFHITNFLVKSIHVTCTCWKKNVFTSFPACACIP